MPATMIPHAVLRSRGLRRAVDFFEIGAACRMRLAGSGSPSVHTVRVQMLAAQDTPDYRCGEDASNPAIRRRPGMRTRFVTSGCFAALQPQQFQQAPAGMAGY